jgi:hypothetical protein
MQAQLHDIETLLAEHGWWIRDRECVADVWWVDQIWTLESIWSPIGESAFLSVLVDPQAPIERGRGEHVWAVCLTRARPTTLAQARPEVPLRPHWNTVHRAEFLKVLESLRSGR